VIDSNEHRLIVMLMPFFEIYPEKTKIFHFYSSFIFLCQKFMLIFYIKKIKKTFIEKNKLKNIYFPEKKTHRSTQIKKNLSSIQFSF
jgi:hypothetical protein